MPKKGMHHTEEWKQRLSLANKGNKYNLGKHHSKETKQKISLGNKWKHNKKLSEEHKKKISLSLIGNTRTLGYKPSEITKRKISLAHKGKKRPPFSEEHKKKLSIARIKYMTSGKHKFKDTSIEIIMENELKRKNIYYEKQVPLCKVCIADFYLPQYRIVIFCDGTYWHSREINQGRDIAQDTVLTFNGFNVYRFTEVEIKKSVKKCIRDIYLAVRKEK